MALTVIRVNFMVFGFLSALITAYHNSVVVAHWTMQSCRERFASSPPNPECSEWPPIVIQFVGGLPWAWVTTDLNSYSISITFLHVEIAREDGKLVLRLALHVARERVDFVLRQRGRAARVIDCSIA